MFKALRYFDVIPPIRCLASTLGDDLPDALSSRNAEFLQSSLLSDVYVRALLSAFPDQDSVDRLRAAAILSEIGASTPTIKRALAMPRVLGLLRETPFDAMRMLGGSLDEAMALAGSLKVSNDERALGFIMWKLADYSRQGHTLVHRRVVESRVPAKIVDRLSAQGKIVRRGEYVQGRNDYTIETSIAREIKRRVNSTVLAWNLEVAVAKMHLTPTQKTAVDMVCSSLFSVISGLPGSGKTHVAQFLQKCIPQSVIVAPTGRALCENYYSRCPLQELTSIPEDTALLLIDDSSMLSMDLLAKALHLAPKSCRVVLIGDINQLLPIDKGFPFRDILNSKACPVTTFDQAYRQVPDISWILDGRLPPDDETLVVETSDENATVAEVARCFKYEGGMVLVPTRNGRDRINTACQYLVHMSMDGTMKQTSGIGEGRRVHMEMTAGDVTCVVTADLMPTIFMHIGNAHYMVEPMTLVGDAVISAHQGEDVCIGDMGVVSDIAGDMVSFKKFGADSPCASMIPKTLTEKAYALTVHKAQGSEFLTVVLPALQCNEWTRRLLYTAATRASFKLSLVGPRVFWEAALARVDPDRLTGLAFDLLS